MNSKDNNKTNEKSVVNKNDDYFVSPDDLLIIKEYIDLMPNEKIFYHAHIDRREYYPDYYDMYFTNYSRIINMKNIKTKNYSLDDHDTYNYWLNDYQIMLIKAVIKYCQPKLYEGHNEFAIRPLMYSLFRIISLNELIDYPILSYDVSSLLTKKDIYIAPNEKIIVFYHENDHPENNEIYCTNYGRIFLIKSTICNKRFCSSISYDYHLNDEQIIILKNIVNSVNYFKLLCTYVKIEMYPIINILMSLISDSNNPDYKSKNDSYIQIAHLTDELNRVTQENKDLHKKLNIYDKIQSFKKKRKELKHEMYMIKKQLYENY